MHLDLIRFFSNAGIMIAASAFVATINADLYKLNDRTAQVLGGNGPRVFHFNSRTARFLRWLHWFVLSCLIVILAGCFACQFEWIRSFLGGEPSWMQECILSVQMAYYGLLGLIMFLICKVRHAGPTP